MEKGREERDPRRMMFQFLRHAPPSQGQVDKDGWVGGRAPSSNSARCPGSSSSSQDVVVRCPRWEIFTQHTPPSVLSSARATHGDENRSGSTSRSSRSNSTGRINENGTTVEQEVAHLSLTASTSSGSGAVFASRASSRRRGTTKSSSGSSSSLALATTKLLRFLLFGPLLTTVTVAATRNVLALGKGKLGTKTKVPSPTHQKHTHLHLHQNSRHRGHDRQSGGSSTMTVAASPSTTSEATTASLLQRRKHGAANKKESEHKQHQQKMQHSAENQQHLTSQKIHLQLTSEAELTQAEEERAAIMREHQVRQHKKEHRSSSYGGAAGGSKNQNRKKRKSEMKTSPTSKALQGTETERTNDKVAEAEAGSTSKKNSHEQLEMQKRQERQKQRRQKQEDAKREMLQKMGITTSTTSMTGEQGKSAAVLAEKLEGATASSETHFATSTSETSASHQESEESKKALVQNKSPTQVVLAEASRMSLETAVQQNQQLQREFKSFKRVKAQIKKQNSRKTSGSTGVAHPHINMCMTLVTLAFGCFTCGNDNVHNSIAKLDPECVLETLKLGLIGEVPEAGGVVPDYFDTIQTAKKKYRYAVQFRTRLPYQDALLAFYLNIDPFFPKDSQFTNYPVIDNRFLYKPAIFPHNHRQLTLSAMSMEILSRVLTERGGDYKDIHNNNIRTDYTNPEKTSNVSTAAFQRADRRDLNVTYTLVNGVPTRSWRSRVATVDILSQNSFEFEVLPVLVQGDPTDPNQQDGAKPLLVEHPHRAKVAGTAVTAAPIDEKLAYETTKIVPIDTVTNWNAAILDYLELATPINKQQEYSYNTLRKQFSFYPAAQHSKMMHALHENYHRRLEIQRERLYNFHQYNVSINASTVRSYFDVTNATTLNDTSLAAKQNRGMQYLYKFHEGSGWAADPVFQNPDNPFAGWDSEIEKKKERLETCWGKWWADSSYKYDGTNFTKHDIMMIQPSTQKLIPTKITLGNQFGTELLKTTDEHPELMTSNVSYKICDLSTNPGCGRAGAFYLDPSGAPFDYTDGNTFAYYVDKILRIGLPASVTRITEEEDSAESGHFHDDTVIDMNKYKNQAGEFNDLRYKKLNHHVYDDYFDDTKP